MPDDGLLTVSGDGTRTRRFCSISDLIDGLQHLPEADVQTPVTIGNPDERTILDLAEIIIDSTDSDSTITHEPLPPQDPQVHQPDIAKARSESSWEPDVSLSLSDSTCSVQQTSSRSGPACS